MANSQIEVSDLFNPLQLFTKLTNSTLDLISQWVSSQIEIRVKNEVEITEGELKLKQSLQEAILCIQVGKYENGRDILISKVLKFDGHNASALFAMGFALLKLGEVERGLEHFERVFSTSYASELEHQLYFFAALKAYTVGLVEYQKYSKAIAMCEKLIAIDPNNFEGWEIKASIFSAQNEYNEAMGCYHAILRLNPSHQVAKEGIIRCFDFFKAGEKKVFLEASEPKKSGFDSNQTSKINETAILEEEKSEDQEHPKWHIDLIERIRRRRSE